MRQILAQVTESMQLWQGVHSLSFAPTDHAPAPGQCVLIRDPLSFDPYLRRLGWLYDSHPDQLSFVLPTEHNESFLARAQVGAFLDLLTPVGHGIEFAASTRHVLLLGEGNRGLALLAIAALAVRSGREVAFSVYACPGEMPVPQHLLAPEIEYHTEQDAAETELLAWADQTIACGSHFFYRRILDHVRQADLQLSQGQVRILIDPVMPCGNGTCGACGVISGRRLQLACVDGPWFDILML